MTKTISYAALAAAMAIAAPAFAQSAAGATQSAPPVNGAESTPAPNSAAATGGEASTPRPSSTTGAASASGVVDQDAAPSATGSVTGAATGAAPSGATTGAAGGSASASTGSATNASATVATGMNVKDSTGATIGQVTEVKADASGQQTATIKMGTDVFAVGTSSLAVKDGAALVNATQAELKAMLKK